ncbi:acetyl-CoA C-acetyltransferase [Vibrio mediterranei]
MEKVFIVAAKRSAIGSFGGSLQNLTAGKLASEVITGAVDACGISVNDIDEVIVGNVVSANQGMGVGRQASIYAGIPAEVPAYTLNMVCGSGMKTLMDAASHIKSGEAEVVVAAGVEIMSQIPFAMPASARSGHKMGDITAKDLLVSDGLTDIFNAYHMGVTAENIAKEVDISRDDQDAYALLSQQKAAAAIEAGKFKQEIQPIEVKIRRQSVEFSTDEYPKIDATMQGLSKLRPAFEREGTVTAGNASGINDGASALVVASESAVERLGLTPLCEVVTCAQTGIDPKVMGLGPVQAVTKVLSNAELTVEDVDVFELNEAFAAQALGVIRNLASQHGVSAESILQRANPNGGAIALGHPLGASGNRIIVTLIHEMLREQKNIGVASLCVGGGMGTAVLLKNCQS